MPETVGPWRELEDLAEAVPYDGATTHADWGRQYGDVVWEQASDDAVRAALYEFGESFLSRRFSDERRAARELSRRLARGTYNGHTEEMLMRTLELPIGVPGEGTRRLGEVNHWWIKSSRRALARMRDGLEANDLRLAYYEAITEPWPDDSIVVLVSDGRVSLASLNFPADGPPQLPTPGAT